MVAQIWHLIHF